MRERWKRVGVSFGSAIAAELSVAIALASIEGRHFFSDFGYLHSRFETPTVKPFTTNHDR
jgi:hypothetical protein